MTDHALATAHEEPQLEVPSDSTALRVPRTHMMLVGNSLFAFGLAGVGVLSLGSGDFPYTWQPVPEWSSGDFPYTWQPVPEWTIWRKYLAFASGLLLLGLGIGMVLKRSEIGRASCR